MRPSLGQPVIMENVAAAANSPACGPAARIRLAAARPHAGQSDPGSSLAGGSLLALLPDARVALRHHIGRTNAAGPAAIESCGRTTFDRIDASRSSPHCPGRATSLLHAFLALELRSRRTHA